MKDNTDRLLDAVEYTDKYSDEEIEALFVDPEIRTFYNMMSKTSDALSEADIPDIDSEWKRLNNEYNRIGLKIPNRSAKTLN